MKVKLTAEQIDLIKTQGIFRIKGELDNGKMVNDRYYYINQCYKATSNADEFELVSLNEVPNHLKQIIIKEIGL